MCLTVGCFRTRQEARDAREPKIAKKAITVYKVLQKNNESPYQNTKYKEGVEIVTEKFSFVIEQYGYGNSKWHLEVEQGLHAMATELDAKKKRRELNDGESRHKIVEMIIPAGTPYFYNHNNTEIVSLKLNWK